MLIVLTHWWSANAGWVAAAFLMLGAFIANPANSPIPAAEGFGLAALIRWMPSVFDADSPAVSALATAIVIAWATAFFLMVWRSLHGTGRWIGWEGFSVLELVRRRCDP